jgi:hypothetical protein
MGSFEGLVGQLFFDYELDGRRLAAIPLYTEVPESMGSVRAAMFTFIAAREERYCDAPALVTQFERGKEITEGTAKYV